MMIDENEFAQNEQQDHDQENATDERVAENQEAANAGAINRGINKQGTLGHPSDQKSDEIKGNPKEGLGTPASKPHGDETRAAGTHGASKQSSSSSGVK